MKPLILTALLFAHAGLAAPEGSASPKVCLNKHGRITVQSGEVAAEIRAAIQAQSAYFEGLRRFGHIRQIAQSRGVAPMHQPRLIAHGKQTDYAIVYVHGLYKSPHFEHHLVSQLSELGYNAVMPLLSGHWNADMDMLNATEWTEWIADIERAIEVAKRLGKKVILAGHSTGALLAVKRHLDKPQESAGLILISPALNITDGMKFAISIADLTGLTGNDIKMNVPDGVEVPYLAPKAGLQARDLALDMRERHGGALDPGEMYKKIKIPVMLVTSSDKIISPSEYDLFEKSVSGPLMRIHNSEVGHGKVFGSKELMTRVYTTAESYLTSHFHPSKWAKFRNKFSEALTIPDCDGESPPQPTPAQSPDAAPPNAPPPAAVPATPGKFGG